MVAGDELYGLDLEDFTAARNALVRELKQRGDKETAAAVASRRRAPVTAWALNQVARGEPTIVDAVLAAGDAVRAAMEQALGGDASRLREAQRAERAVLEAALDAAARRLEAAGRSVSDGNRQRMEQTLRAAMHDQDAAARLRSGLLDTDLQATGFGLDAALVARAPVRSGPEKRPEKGSGKSSTGEPDAAKGQGDAPPVDELRERRRRDAALEHRKQRDRATTLRRRATRLEAKADEAESQARSAREVADAAVREADEAEAQADASGPGES